MSNNLKVSVVMSVHNDAQYLHDSVSSVLQQEGVDFEFIVINDGSTDDSGELLEEYACKDPRLVVVHQSNKGLTRSLIKGCSLARGKYIARQDADDISFPHRFLRLSTELDEHPEAVLVASLVVLMGPNSEILHYENNRASRGYRDHDTFCHGSLMFRRDVYAELGGYRAEFRAAQDVDLQLRLAEAGRFRLLPDLLYAHRIADRSISATSPIQKRLSRLAEAASNARREGLDERSILAKAAAISSDSSLRRRAEPGTGNYFIGRCLYARRDRRALPYLWRAFKSEPVSLRTWLALTQAAFLTRSNLGHNVSLSGISPQSEPTR